MRKLVLTLVSAFLLTGGAFSQEKTSTDLPQDKAAEHKHTANCNHFKEPVTILIYSLKGLKSEEDGHVIEDALKGKDIILECEVHFMTSNIYVTVRNDKDTYIVKEMILAVGEKIGYPLTVNYVRQVYQQPLPEQQAE